MIAARTAWCVVFALAAPFAGAACAHSAELADVAPPPRPPAAPAKKDRVVPAPLFTFSAHDAGVVALALSPDARTLVTAGADEPTAKVWDLAGRKFRCDLAQSFPVTGLAFSPDGKRLATSSALAKVTSDGNFLTHGQLLVWDAATCKQLGAPMPDARLVDHVAWSPDGKLLACVESKARKVRLFDAGTSAFLRAFDASDASTATLAFFPDGRTLAVTRDDGVDLWDVASGAARAQLQSPTAALAIAPDGRTFATASGRDVTWWRADGEHVRSVKALGESGNALAFFPDARRLISGGDAATLDVWSSASGERTQTLRAHDDAVSALAIAKDGTVLVSGARDGGVAVWALE